VWRCSAALVFAALCASAAALAADGTPQAEASEARGAEDCAAAVAARVQQHYEGIRDLEASFTQRTQSVAFGGGSLAEAEPSSGTVVFAKPGKMRWHYETPQPSLVVSDGETLWLYDPIRKEAQRVDVTQGYLSGAALAFLFGDGDLRREFDIVARECDQPIVRLLLQPRRAASYERIELRAIANSGDVVETLVVDLFGNRTEVAFRDVRVNRSPPPERFRFEAGPEVQVIDLSSVDR
jgi:outer membrane lipoprotein carrier protein